MQYSTLLRVGARPFNPHAPGRHRLLREEMACAPRLHDLWPEVHPWLIGCPLAAHNAATERKMLQQAAPLHRFGPWIDSLKLVRVAYPELPSHRMEDVLEILNLMDRVRECCPDREPHDALFDAAGCAALLEHLLHLPGWEQLTVEALTRARPRTFRRHVRARKRRK
jgi:DNA polymerase III epsilon subunit-like protein